MRRQVVLTVLVLAGVHLAAAQKIDCRPRKLCDRPVVFTPTAQEFGAALGGVLLPTTPTGPIEVELKRDQDEPYDVTMEATPWVGPGSLSLQVRVTSTGPGAPTDVLDWTALDQVPWEILRGDAKKTHLTLEYRLLVMGGAPPGQYSTTVETRVSDARQNRNKRDTITNEIIVVVPSYVALRIRGAEPSTARLIFDLQADPAAYLRAVTLATSVPPTSATFDAVELATNDPAGCRIVVHVSAASGPLAGLDLPALSLFGAPADGQTLSVSHATEGYEVIARPGDYGLHVDGGEASGTASFTVTFSVAPAP